MSPFYHSDESLSEVACFVLQIQYTMIGFFLLCQLYLFIRDKSLQPNSVVLAQGNIHIADYLFPLRVGPVVLQLVEIIREEDILFLFFLVGCLHCAFELRVLPVAECAG